MYPKIILKLISSVQKNVQGIQPYRRISYITRPLTLLSDDEITFKNQVSKIASVDIAPHVKEMERNGKFSKEVMDTLFSNGLMGMEAPFKYGGSECSFMSIILAIEELAKVDASVAVIVDIQNTLILRFLNILGTSDQKDKYLPLLATNGVGAFALSEQTSGSDAFALKTTARLKGDKFIINGSKMWISNSDFAKLFIVMANVDPSKGYKGITSFLVDSDNPGLTVVRKEDKLGLRASATCELNFDQCEIPKENVLGDVGQGYKYAINYLNEGRIGIGAQMIGIAQGALDATIPYTIERKQFNQNLFSYQAIQHQITRLVTELETARLLVYNAARLVDAKANIAKEAAMAKYYSSEIAGKITSQCIDLMGGVGFTTSYPQEKFYRDVKAGTIYEGATNILLNTISKRIKEEYEK